MKMAVRCLYHYAVRPNFIIIDLENEIWKKFLSANKYERIRIIRPFIKKPGSSGIREIAWIPLKDLKDSEMMDLELACKELMTEECRGPQFKEEKK